MDTIYQKRAESLLAVDEMIGDAQHAPFIDHHPCAWLQLATATDN